MTTGEQHRREDREQEQHLRLRPSPGLSWTGVAAAASSVGGGLLAALVLTRWLPPHSAALVFIVAVLISAASFGGWAGVLAAGLSFLAYNFFFIEPLYTFTVGDPQDVFALAVFLVVAAATGRIAGRLRDRTTEARNYAERVEALHQLSLTLSGATIPQTILAAAAAELARVIDGRAVVLIPDETGLVLRAAHPETTSLSDADLQAAHRALRRGEAVPMPATGYQGARFEFRVLVTGSHPLGVVGLAPRAIDGLVTASAEPAVEAVLRLTAIALERATLAAENEKAREEATQERLRSALLSSLSHDLRTPLATIMGAASSLRQLADQMSSDERADLLGAIEEEGARLSRFVSNLLEMTRLEAGSIDLMRDWLDVADTIRPVVERAVRQFPQSHIEATFEPWLPLIRAEAQGLEQIVLNLIENAARYTSLEGKIAVGVSRSGENVVVSVTDDGPGIPREEHQRVFDKLYRLRRGDRGVPGTGLGLAICRAIVDGMNGSIQIESPVADGRGTRVVVRLPVPLQPAIGEVQG